VLIARQVQAEIAPGRWDKGDRTPVTVADLGVQAVVSAALQERFPHDPLMAEEESRELREPAWNDLLVKVTEHVRLVRPRHTEPAAILDWIERGQHEVNPGKRYWVLDPVDGTKGFSAKGAIRDCAGARRTGGRSAGRAGLPQSAGVAAHDRTGTAAGVRADLRRCARPGALSASIWGQAMPSRRERRFGFPQIPTRTLHAGANGSNRATRTTT